MLYRIDTVDVDDRSGYLRVVVQFWASKKDQQRGEPPAVVNDFYNNYRGDRLEPLPPDEMGRLSYGGQRLVPFVEVEGSWRPRPGADTRPLDIPGRVHSDIVDWWNKTGKDRKGDRRDPGFKKAGPEKDPLNSLKRDDVKAMAGKVWDDGV